MSNVQPEKAIEKKREQNDVGTIPSVEHFLFNTPLYAKCPVTHEHMEIMYGRNTDSFGGKSASKIDGYCPFCKRASTFEIKHIHIPSGDPWNNIATRYAFDDISIKCVRNDLHTIRYYLLVHKMTVTKARRMG
jgi:hypothetical protein